MYMTLPDPSRLERKVQAHETRNSIKLRKWSKMTLPETANSSQMRKHLSTWYKLHYHV